MRELANRLETAVGKMLYRLDALTAENKKLKADCERLRAAIAIKTQEVRAAESQLETYKIAAALRGTNVRDAKAEENARAAKARISQMVQEIDQCIALLKQ